MNKMMNMVKGALALAMVACVGTAQAAQAITFTARTQSKTYDGTPLNAAYDITSGSLKTRTMFKVQDKVESVTYDTNSRTDAGETTYTITSVKIVGGTTGIDYTSEYSVTKVGGTLTITPATVTSMTLNGPTALPYTGNPQTVTVKEVKAGNLTLSSSDYDVSGNTATQPGQYTVTVTGKGNYQGTATADWEIKSHEHKWSYATSVDGNVVTLTATCTNPDCTINPPTTSATLTLSSGDKTYDGQAITATLDKGDFEATTGITLGDVQCTGNATDAGTYKFSVSADGTGCDFGKSVTISQLDITSSTTITLSATDLKYTGAEQTVTIQSVKVGNLDVSYTEDGDSVRTEKAIGTYTVKITGKGNFTGKASRNWTISNYSGQLKSLAAAVSGLGTVDGTTLTVTDSSKLEYDAENQVWYAGLTLTWDMTKGDNYNVWVDPSKGYAVYTRPGDAQMTVGETTFTGAQSGAYADGKVDNATDSLTYSKNLGNSKTRTYLATTTWRVKLTPAIIEAAKSAGSVTGTMYAGALPFTSSDDPESSPGIEFKNYTITVPIDANLKLYDEVGNQVYPAVNYVAQVAETKLKYLTLDAALKAAEAGQTVNALAACEQAAFSVGANVTLNLAGFGAAGATYEFVDVTDQYMDAKVVSDKQETVTTGVAGFAVKNDNNTYTLYRSHFHLWEFVLDGATLTANCTNMTTECDLPGRKTSITLTVTGGSDGVAPTFEIANKDAFIASVNKFGTMVTSIGDIVTVRTTDDGAATTKWYVGDYRATCDVEIVGEGTLTLTNEFSIAKPEGGYAKNGWIAGSRDVRYDSWEESLAAASDGDTVYYKGDDRNYKTHEFSIGAKNLTLDFGGKTLEYTNGTEDMTLKNAGSGTLTFQNVTIQQPKYLAVSHQISAVGNIQFGTGVKTTNMADNKDRYLKITASDGTLTVTNGQYECSFAGAYKLRGGQYKSTYGEPTADTANGYIVRTVSGDYDRDIVYHEHHIAYAAEGNVISATCDAQDHEFCGYGTKTATLNAPDKQEDGQPYNLASIVYSDGFPEQTGVITYWNGDEEIDAPTTFGSYTAKTTIGGATAVKAFQVIHHHNFEYDADQDAGTITARCTTTEDCDFNVNKRIATLTANNGTYTGFGQDLASTATNTGDFPTNVVMAYSCEGKPTNVGDYTATMTVADKSVEKGFSIAKASMSNVAITVSGTSMDYTGGSQSVSIGSVKLGDYTLVEGTDYTVDESSVFSSSGSGAQDTTSTIKIVGKGNFADDAQTATWKIVAPTRDFKGFSIPGDYAGTLSGTTVTMAGANWKYCAAGTAPDGNPDAGWYTCLQIDWPVATLQFTRPEAALHTLSTNPGEQFWGSALPENGNVLTVDADKAAASDIKYVNYTWWHVRMTPEIAEACEDEAFTRSMTACGIKWSKSGSLYGDSAGVREVTCTVTQPMADTLVLTVPMGATYDLGTNKLAKSALKLAKNAIVTTTVEQVEGKIFTEEDGYSVYCIKDGDVFKYVCWLATHYVTVPDVAHATKVVKVGDTVKEPTEAGGSVYAVFHGDTVTATYTPDAGYETADGTKTIANVTEDTELTDLPTIVAVFTVAAPKNATVTKVATNGVELVSPYKVLPGTAVTVTYTADEGYLFANGTNTMDAEIVVNEAGEQQAPAGTETTEGEAKIGTTYYLTLKAAVGAAVEGNTITLVKDITTTEYIVFNKDLNVTLDMNGKTISSAADECLVMGAQGASPLGAGTLTITGGGSVIQTYAGTDADVVWARWGNVVISNGYFEVNGTYQCVYSTSRAQVKIYGGTFKNLTGGDVLNVNNEGETTDIQCYGGSYSKNPATGDDSLKGSFVAEGYASYKDGEMFTVAKLPAVTVTDITPPADLEAAFQYATTDTTSAFTGGWKVDFYVSFDADVAAGAVLIKGKYGQFDWTGAPLPAMAADEELPLMQTAGNEVSVEQLLAMQTFDCGVTNVSAKGGTTMKVVLKMYKGDETFVLNTKTYELVGKGPTIVDPIGGDPETYPEIKPVEDTNGVYYVEVKTNTTTVVKIDGLKEDDTVIVPPQINAVNGTETSPIATNQVKVVADATNGTQTVKVDITDAFTIKEEGNGVLIELNSNAVVTVKIEGKDPEDVPVTPELTDSEDDVKPLVIDDTKVATGVKTIPGLKYSLLSGDTVTKIDTLVKTIVAEDTRVVLEAVKSELDPAKFYKIQVAK